ncbi:hypothetical protein HCN44_002742 [Aphidius gifuensis]|uniref:Uncharacterized protein n=1 Tax=Aphidius gifuensis TaxID=684658 RepID=A0A834XSP9_APHGI|nr:uncharacterized protein LOC122854427 [Aphidius gifuensis]KAF7991180.1 hypothetical protein HCN44_002742 [Aphidius gifuensis]
METTVDCRNNQSSGEQSNSESPDSELECVDMPICALWWRENTDFEINDVNNTNDIETVVLDESTDNSDDLIEQVDPIEIDSDKKSRPRDSGPRVKQPENWKVNVKKIARLKGEEYIGKGGKIVPAKLMGPPCDCRMLCSEKVSEKIRNQLHEVFWKTCNWEQRKQYIAMSVKESPKKRTRVPGKKKEETRRQVTLTYSLIVDNENITVCKTMFLRTFSLSEKFVRHAMEKKRTSPGGIIGPDQRGRHTPITKKSEKVKNLVREHINSFPTDNIRDKNGKKYLDSTLNIATMHKLYVQKSINDGVPSCDIVKESYYREMFKNEFNLGFKPLPVARNNKKPPKKIKRLNKKPSAS